MQRHAQLIGLGAHCKSSAWVFKAHACLAMTPQPQHAGEEADLQQAVEQRAHPRGVLGIAESPLPALDIHCAGTRLTPGSLACPTGGDSAPPHILLPVSRPCHLELGCLTPTHSSAEPPNVNAGLRLEIEWRTFCVIEVVYNPKGSAGSQP